MAGRRGKAGTTLAGLLAAAALSGCTPIAPTPVAAPPATSLAGGLRPASRAASPSGTPRALRTVTSRPTPEPTATLTTPLPSPSASASADLCPAWQRQSPGNVQIAATPGPGSVSFAWFYSGDREILYFRMAAVPERPAGDARDTEAHVRYSEVQVGGGCEPLQMNATLGDLTSGERYEVWLTAVYKRHDGLPGVRDRQIGHSLPVTVL
jgi:hypothetical protein